MILIKQSIVLQITKKKEPRLRILHRLQVATQTNNKSSKGRTARTVGFIAARAHLPFLTKIDSLRFLVAPNNWTSTIIIAKTHLCWCRSSTTTIRQMWTWVYTSLPMFLLITKYNSTSRNLEWNTIRVIQLWWWKITARNPKCLASRASSGRLPRKWPHHIHWSHLCSKVPLRGNICI